ncbi:MAG: putative N-acetyl-LL-diaminopimelate aminotransferase [Chlamydiae bacterium]|nr:putative N-acetyl-LL-diaminopimelate aminotransferase [Chlamydiota bacterium]
MFTPSGIQSREIDPTMLLNMWAHYLDDERDKDKMIFAGIGRPTYPVNSDFAKAAMEYWKHFVNQDQGLINLETGHLAIDYDLPAGDLKAREKMARALSNWYKTPIDADELIFSVGGSSALRMIFNILNKTSPNKKTITTLPYYPFYNHPSHHNKLHFINLLQGPSCRLTAAAFEAALQSIDLKDIGAILFCDPNNPLGFVTDESEWKKIAEIIQSLPEEIPIILDEAYAELTFISKHTSLLQLAPTLKNRIILLRSSTKGFSASGERIAVIVCSNPLLKEALIEETIFSYAHAPKSLQYAYSEGMLAFSEKKRALLASSYHKQVQYVLDRTNKMGILFQKEGYKIEGAFYIIVDLSHLFGNKIDQSASKALGYSGTICTDVELCYSLLFKKRIMLCPLSFFGADPNAGLIRITCSGGTTELSLLLDRLDAVKTEL